MNVLDLGLILLVIGYGVAGFRQGFLIGAAGVIGLVAGGAAGAVLAPYVLEQFEPDVTVSLGALAAVVVLALIGQALGSMLGEALRARVTWRPAHAVDAGAGAALSVVAVLVVVWILGAAVAGAHLGEVSRVVRSSAILRTVDRVMPDQAEQAVLAFSEVVDPGMFPRFLEPFAPERIRPAEPPDAQVIADSDIERAAASVVRVNSLSMRCGHSVAGSGFVYESGLVMTNAHVVAGSRTSRVETRDGQGYDAEVVLYDPARDVAVLSVPGLERPALPLDDSASTGDGGAVLGYPGDGPFHVVPARIRAEKDLRGPDIYGQQQVVREVFSLYAEVRPGNSGGPVVSPDGAVIGLVFAASVEDGSTGYALTVDEIESDARKAARADQPVGTGSCAP